MSTWAQAWRNTRWVLREFCAKARAPRLRTMREFAEQELVIPEGKWKDEKFRAGTAPWTGLMIDAMDRWRGRKITATGPVQSGKTLIFLILVVMYHVFEMKETVVIGIPDMDMAYDKWTVDLKPAILASRYRDQMPQVGGGSRGGKVELIQFQGGGAIKFMSGGGSDSALAGFTTRVLVITETDKMAKSGPTSQEANRISQLEARTRAWGEQARIYKECTVTTAEGYTWQEYSKGTASRILTPCPHCECFVEFGREQLQGWREAGNEIEAREKSAFVCPECGRRLSEEDRVWSNQRGVLVHRGQQCGPDGVVTGEPLPTETLGLRWSGFHNLFTPSGMFGAEEWLATRAVDADDAEKGLRQQWWCLPYVPPRVDMSALDPDGITRRVTNYARGIVPEWASHVTVGIDVGKWLLHWQAIAWGTGYSGQVIDYDVIEVPSAAMGEERAVPLALRRLRDEFITPGWKGASGSVVPTQVWVDCGWQGKKEQPDFVYKTVREFNGGAPPQNHRWRPAKGFGTNQYAGESYRAPLKVQGDTLHVGDHYHLERIIRSGQPNYVVHLSADHWKMFFHSRLGTPVGHEGALTLFARPPHEHLSVARHYTAEKKFEEFKPGVGVVVKWVRTHRENHFLDAGMLATAAAHWCGIRLVAPPAQRPAAAAAETDARKGLRMPDGRAYLASQR